MTPEQKLKALILKTAQTFDQELPLPELTAENVDELYDKFEDGEFECAVIDAREEIRSSGEETNIPAQFSRHYESDSVAVQALDGSWVGFTYWHGGGKHGEPEAVPWMEHAYDLTITGEKTVTIRTFAKA